MKDENKDPGSQVGDIPVVMTPDWWPKNPYPESVFSMTESDYVEAIPDENLRTSVSGFVGRQTWELASRSIMEAIDQRAVELEYATMSKEELVSELTQCVEASDQPIVMRLMVDVTFDPIIGNSAKSEDSSERDWFENELLGDTELFLHSNLIGDTIGTVEVVNLLPANFTDADVKVVASKFA